MREFSNAEMSTYTSFKTGGKVRRFVIVDAPDELRDFLNKESVSDDAEPLLLGNGSNTLFAAPLYDGIVIKLGEAFDYVEFDEAGSSEESCTTVRAGAATLLSRLAKAAGAKGLTGLEFAAGIPGSVGGAVFMNAGAYDGEIKDTLTGIKALCKVKKERGMESWEIRCIPAEDLDLSYRHSRIMETGDIVLEAEFRLKSGDAEKIKETMRDFSERRSSKQPLEYPSAGSFFKRPPGSFAGKLIEDAGLKGFTVGGAQVSEKHAGFVINKGDATPEDILELMEKVQEEVNNKFGVMLEPEVRIIR